MTNQLAIVLDDDQQRRLEAIAAARQETPSDVAAQAVAEYLAEDAAFRLMVEEGLAAGKVGDIDDFQPFAADLRRRMAARDAENR